MDASPGFPLKERTIHAPKLHLAVVCSRNDKRERRVKCSPIHAAVVPFEDVLDDGVASAKEVSVDLLGQAQNVLCWRDGFLPEAADVPHPDSLVEGGRDDEVLLGVEGGAHDVVVVTCEDAQAGATLPIPNADGLVVGSRYHPGVLVVEVHSPDVVQMAHEGEKAPPGFVVPHLNLVVIAC